LPVYILTGFVNLTAQFLPIFNRHMLTRTTHIGRTSGELATSIGLHHRILVRLLLGLRRRWLELLPLLPLLLLVHVGLSTRPRRGLT
jgi:hypothetical protein